ncbi:MAG: hypothetical protein V1873_01605, partial [Verrucomicrobiota bacterium]
NTAGLTATNTYVTIQNLSTNNLTNYVATMSTATATTFTATSVWQWTKATEPTILSMMAAVTNAVRATLRDRDFDRQNDQLSVTNTLFGYLRVTDDDTNAPLAGSEISTLYRFAVSVDGYYANFINDYFEGITLKNQWRWEAEDSTAGRVNNGLLELYPTSAWRQVAIGSTHQYTWVNKGEFTYSFSVRRMFASNQFQAQMFLVGQDAGGQPTTYADYDSPYVLFMRVLDTDTGNMTNWNQELYLKTNGAGRAAYDTGQPGVRLIASVTNLAYVTNMTFGFRMNDTNVLLFATNPSVYLTYITNITAVMRGYFSTQAYVYVGGKNDNASPVAGEYLYITNVRAMPTTMTSNTIHELLDGDLGYVSGSDPLRLLFNVYDPVSGIARGTTDSNRNMNVSVANLTTNNVSNYWAAGSSADSTPTTATNVWRWTNFSGTAIQTLIDALSNKVTSTYRDDDLDRTNDQLSVSNQLFGYIRITDDDTIAPTLGDLVVMVGGTAAPIIAGSGTTNVTFRVTDGELRGATTVPVRLSFKVWDNTGINRGSTAGTNMNITWADLVTNDVSRYSPPPTSSYDTIYNWSTSVWTFSSFTFTEITNLFGTNQWEGTGTSHRISANIPDADWDRAGDALWRSNAQFGWIFVTDDDTNPPVTSTFTPGNMLPNNSFEQPGRMIASSNYPYYWFYDDPDHHGGYWGNFARENWGHYPSDYGGWEARFGGTNMGGATNAGAWRQVTNELGAGSVWEAWAWIWRDSWTARVVGITLEFRDVNDNLVGGRTNAFALPTQSNWTYVSVVATSPAAGVFARWVMWCEDVSALGALSFDDIGLRPLTNVNMDLLIGLRSFYISGSGTSAWFRVTDGDLAMVSPSNYPMKWVFSTYDPTSGVYRSTDLTKTGVNYDVGTHAELQNIYTTYWASWSSPDVDTKSAGATSVFRHVTNFTIGYNAATETGQVKSLMDMGGLWISLSAPDDDFDRDYLDNKWLYDSKVGQLVVIDDDITGPWAWTVYLGTNWTPGSWDTTDVSDAEMAGGFDFAHGWWDYSGLFLTNQNAAATNTDGLRGWISPNLDLVNPAGVTQVTDWIVPATNLFAREGNG